MDSPEHHDELTSGFGQATSGQTKGAYGYATCGTSEGVNKPANNAREGPYSKTKPGHDQVVNTSTNYTQQHIWYGAMHPADTTYCTR